MGVIVSPLPGVFYRRSGPGKAEFANEGDTVEAGQTLAVVEIMKQFTEIQSDADGVIERFLVAEFSAINPGDAIIVVRAKGE